MKKRKFILSLLLSLIVVHITSVIFIYFYESLSIIGNGFVLLINIIAVMYFVKMLLGLFEGKIKKDILRVIFFIVLFLNVFVGIMTFYKFVW